MEIICNITRWDFAHWLRHWQSKMMTALCRGGRDQLRGDIEGGARARCLQGAWRLAGGGGDAWVCWGRRGCGHKGRSEWVPLRLGARLCQIQHPCMMRDKLDGRVGHWWHCVTPVTGSLGHWCLHPAGTFWPYWCPREGKSQITF